MFATPSSHNFIVTEALRVYQQMYGVDPPECYLNRCIDPNFCTLKRENTAPTSVRLAGGDDVSDPCHFLRSAVVSVVLII